MYKKIKILIIILFVILIFFGLFVKYNPPVSGIILDSLTKQPVFGVPVERIISYNLPIPPFPDGIHGDIKYDTLTNEKGEFRFGFKISPKIGHSDTLYINEFGTRIKNYTKLRREDSSFVTLSNPILLEPTLNIITKCGNDAECLAANSAEYLHSRKSVSDCSSIGESGMDILAGKNGCIADFAISTNNLSICYLISRDLVKDMCIKDFAIAKNNISVCDFINDFDENNYCVANIKYCEKIRKK